MGFASATSVTFATTSYPTRRSPAAGAFVAALADALVAAGWSVSVVALAGRGDQPLPQAGVRVELVETPLVGDVSIAQHLRTSPASARHVPAAIGRMARRLRAADGVVHAHWLPTAGAARLARRPFVVTAHGSDLALATRSPRPIRAVVGSASVIVGTEQAAAEARRVLPAARTVVIPPQGVARDPVPFAAAATQAALVIARLSAEKGIADLAAAWRLVHADLPAAELHVVGDGPLRDALVLPGVVHHGALPPADVRDRIGAAAVVVQASPREGYGIATLEAIAAGRGVIATRTGVAAELLAATPAARLVEPGDAVGLAAALRAVLADPTATATMAAATDAVALPGWDDVVAAHERAYAEARR